MLVIALSRCRFSDTTDKSSIFKILFWMNQGPSLKAVGGVFRKSLLVFLNFFTTCLLFELNQPAHSSTAFLY